MFGDFDLNALMQQAQKLQEDMMRAQDEVSAKSFTASAGGDLVTLTLNGKGELTELKIAPQAWDPQDPDTLSDLIIAAFRAAKAEVDAAVSAALPAMPPGMPGLPGMGG